MSTRAIVLGVIGCFLIGGTYSFYKQGVPRFATVFTGLLAVLALAGAVLWSV
jgi:hypothetical protein